jgi:hypothetical protein
MFRLLHVRRWVGGRINSIHLVAKQVRIDLTLDILAPLFCCEDEGEWLLVQRNRPV